MVTPISLWPIRSLIAFGWASRSISSEAWVCPPVSALGFIEK